MVREGMAAISSAARCAACSNMLVGVRDASGCHVRLHLQRGQELRMRMRPVLMTVKD